MEYLPEKRRTQKTQVMKKEAKIADFRNYLADEQVVLAMVKCKLKKCLTELLQSWLQSDLNNNGLTILKAT